MQAQGNLYKTGKVKMDTIAIFDQNISFMVLLQLNRRESDGYVDMLVVWNGPVVDDLQQLEL